MFREVVLISHRPGEDADVEIVRARPVGRAYTWRDTTTPGVGGVSLLFEGEDGRWFVQQINFFPKFGFFAIYFPFLDFEDAECTFPEEVRYILS